MPANVSEQVLTATRVPGCRSSLGTDTLVEVECYNANGNSRNGKGKGAGTTNRRPEEAGRSRHSSPILQGRSRSEHSGHALQKHACESKQVQNHSLTH